MNYRPRFGRVYPELEIHGKPAPYPVLNERDARASAGIMLLIGSVAFVQAFLLKEYWLIDLVVLVFVLEFALRLIDPHIAPLYALGRLFVSRMRPEYVGAAQKRFAWALGLLMALTVSVLIHVFAIRGLPNMIFCSVCLFLMWLEASFGYCLGCKIYYRLMHHGLVKKPEHAPACPGGACPLPKR